MERAPAFIHSRRPARSHRARPSPSSFGWNAARTCCWTTFPGTTGRARPRRSASAESELAAAQGGDALEQPLQQLLELLRPRDVGALKLAPQLALTEAPDQLLTRRGVDTFRLGARVELCQQDDRVTVQRHAVDDVRADPAVNRVVEVLFGQLGEEW